MRRIPTERLKAGDQLGRDVYARPDVAPLLRAGSMIGDGVREALLRAGIACVWIDDEATRGIEPIELVSAQTSDGERRERNRSEVARDPVERLPRRRQDVRPGSVTRPVVRILADGSGAPAGLVEVDLAPASDLANRLDRFRCILGVS